MRANNCRNENFAEIEQNCKSHREPFSRSFGINETQQLYYTRRATGGSNVASEASYWCNRRETSEIQARPYSGARHSYAHAQYIQACIIAERLSARQIIPRRISEIVWSRLGMQLFRACACYRQSKSVHCAVGRPPTQGANYQQHSIARSVS